MKSTRAKRHKLDASALPAEKLMITAEDVPPLSVKYIYRENQFAMGAEAIVKRGEIIRYALCNDEEIVSMLTFFREPGAKCVRLSHDGLTSGTIYGSCDLRGKLTSKDTPYIAVKLAETTQGYMRSNAEQYPQPRSFLLDDKSKHNTPQTQIRLHLTKHPGRPCGSFIHIVNDDVLTASIPGVMNANYQYWYHIPTGNIVVKQISDYLGLLVLTVEDGNLRLLSPEADSEIRSRIEIDLKYACLVDDRGNILKYVLPKTQATYKKQGSLSSSEPARHYPWVNSFPGSTLYEDCNGAKMDAQDKVAIQLLTAAGT